MIKYRVNLGCYDFVFTSAETAVDYAFTAKRHTTEESLHVNIEFIDVEKPKKPEEETEDPEDD